MDVNQMPDGTTLAPIGLEMCECVLRRGSKFGKIYAREEERGAARSPGTHMQGNQVALVALSLSLSVGGYMAVKKK